MAHSARGERRESAAEPLHLPFRCTNRAQPTDASDRTSAAMAARSRNVSSSSSPARRAAWRARPPSAVHTIAVPSASTAASPGASPSGACLVARDAMTVSTSSPRKKYAPGYGLAARTRRSRRSALDETSSSRSSPAARGPRSRRPRSARGAPAGGPRRTLGPRREAARARDGRAASRASTRSTRDRPRADAARGCPRCRTPLRARARSRRSPRRRVDRRRSTDRAAAMARQQRRVHARPHRAAPTRPEPSGTSLVQNQLTSRSGLSARTVARPSAARLGCTTARPRPSLREADAYPRRLRGRCPRRRCRDRPPAAEAPRAGARRTRSAEPRARRGRRNRRLFAELPEQGLRAACSTSIQSCARSVLRPRNPIGMRKPPLSRRPPP